MITLLSVITSVKDYIEIAHKLIEVDSSPDSQSLWLIQNYTEFGAFLTYFLITLKQFCIQLFGFQWLKNIWSLPVMVPEIASAMVSEISVLDGFFHNAFTFLDTPLSYGQYGSTENFNVYAFEKFFIGFVNSFFLFLPTSTAHIITIRRFVMQGLEAGYISALGTIAGNFLWLCSIIFGWRFFVIPWLSFDIFRYVLGFILLVKYMWDCSKERRMVLQDLSKVKIFLLNFLLALTEQTSIYPFISNLSISPDGSMLETSPLPMVGMGLAAMSKGDSLEHFIFIHACYLLGILIGSLSFLKFTCWFWENPAFNLYMWVISSYLKNTKMTTSYFYKLLNFTFLYLTMVCAVSSIGYFGLDYTLTNPLGFIAQDRLIEQKEFGDPTDQKSEKGRFFPELSHLSVNATDKNSRTRGGIRGRRERWKESLLKYQMLDSSLYDQSMYSFLTVEDLNYGFDRFWLRRKMRNHKMSLRLLPGPLVRGLKKQLNPDKRVLRSDNKSSESEESSSDSSDSQKYAERGLNKKQPPREYEAKGVEFFRLLFEQYYHPNFHKVSNESKRLFSTSKVKTKVTNSDSNSKGMEPSIKVMGLSHKGLEQNFNLQVKNLRKDEFSALRKFTRNFNTRLKSFSPSLRELGLPGKNKNKSADSDFVITSALKALPTGLPMVNQKQPSLHNKLIYSKKWKTIFSKLFQSQSYPSGGNKIKTNSRKATFFFRNMSRNRLSKQQQPYQGHGFLLGTTNLFPTGVVVSSFSKAKANSPIWESTKKTMSRQKLSKKDRQILRYRTLLKNNKKQAAYSSHGKMLHTLKFYLQKEEAFKRKLKFYGASVFRKLSVGNNAPFFKTMMKRFFYYYKPSLRYKRTLESASSNTLYRQGSRKKSRVAKKLTKNSVNQNQKVSSSATLEFTSLSGASQPNFSKERGLGVSSLTKPTHSYSILGKKASRYRYQIYRDVLQHWYYTPFNRLLLKLDIDAFMSRQPRAHFLTKKEEHLLHQRRFLLAEHYDTVRWYTYMQHYSSMKSKIGGTKSFSSGIYNQQFQGTFKKIRHLFAITPSQSLLHSQEQDKKGNRGSTTDSTGGFILKFDQPLYNEYFNTQESSIINSSVNHEELENMLLAQQKLNLSQANSNAALAYPKGVGSAPQQTDLISESSNILGNYLFKAAPIRQQFIAKLLKEKDYWQLTQFMSQGDPILDPKILHLASTPTLGKGVNPQLNLIPGSYPSNHAEQQLSAIKEVPGKKEASESLFDSLHKKVNIQQELWVKLLKQNKRHINDREFIANYVKHRINVTEERNKEKQEQIQVRLSNLNVWLNNLSTHESSNNLSTGLQKSTKEALKIASHNNGESTTSLSESSSLYSPSPFSLNATHKKNKIQKQLDKLNLLMGKVKNVIHSLTLPIIALDKEKRTLSWWRKKQQARFQRKSNLIIYHKPLAYAVYVSKKDPFPQKKYPIRIKVHRQIHKIKVAHPYNKEKEDAKKEAQIQLALEREEDRAFEQALEENREEENTNGSDSASLLATQAQNERLQSELPAMSSLAETKEATDKQARESNERGALQEKERYEAALLRISSLAETKEAADTQARESNERVAFNYAEHTKEQEKSEEERMSVLKAALIQMSSQQEADAKQARACVACKPKTVENEKSEEEKAKERMATVEAALLRMYLRAGASSPQTPESNNNILWSRKQPSNEANGSWSTSGSQSTSEDQAKLKERSALLRSANEERYKAELDLMFSEEEDVSNQARENNEREALPERVQEREEKERAALQEKERDERNWLVLIASWDEADAKQALENKERAAFQEKERAALQEKERAALQEKEARAERARLIRIKYKEDVAQARANGTFPFISPGDPDYEMPSRGKRDLAQSIIPLFSKSPEAKPPAKHLFNNLFSNFFTVKYKKRNAIRYKTFSSATGYSEVLKASYLDRFLQVQDKKSQQELLQYVIKFAPPNTSKKKDQQRTGIAQTRARTNPYYNLQTYTKRNIKGLGKLRMLIKKIHRIKSNLLLQNWWWQVFLPNYQAELQYQLQQPQLPTPTKYNHLSTLFFAWSPQGQDASRELQVKENGGILAGLSAEGENVLAKIYANLFTPSSSKANFDILVTGEAKPIGAEQPERDLMLPYIKPVNPLPFYAGWDESLRKLVITNRFLSRRQAGHLLQPVLLPNGKIAPKTPTGLNGLNEGSYLYNQMDMPFNTYAIEQFNGRAQTFYAPLGWRRFQFRHSILKTWFSLSPSLAKAKLASSNSLNPKGLEAGGLPQARTLDNFQASKYFSHLSKGDNWMANSVSGKQAQKNMHRRTKKRFSLMVNPSRLEGDFTYMPTGTLLTEVLPSHYLSIYDHQYRFPDSRYLQIPFADLTSYKKPTLSISPNACGAISFEAALKREPDEKYNAQKAKEKRKSVPAELRCLLSTTMGNNIAGNGVSLDFTLRKRIKTKRKYHRKRTISKNGLVFPRRRKFVQHTGSKPHPEAASSEGELRWRPSSFKKLRNLKQEKNKKRATASAARLKQLRPREVQQVLIPTQRFQPRQGGFIWPGQYLLLEYTYLPADTMAVQKVWTRKEHDLSLDFKDRFFGQSSYNPYKFKEAIAPSEVELASGFEGAIPRKYLIQKHNIKVLKKKLGKAHHSNKLQQRVKQLNYILGD